jgi:hypothetical protein
MCESCDSESVTHVDKGTVTATMMKNFFRSALVEPQHYSTSDPIIEEKEKRKPTSGANGSN